MGIYTVNVNMHHDVAGYLRLGHGETVGMEPEQNGVEEVEVTHKNRNLNTNLEGKLLIHNGVHQCTTEVSV